MTYQENSFDFIVVGSGAGGLAAALTAHHSGLKTLVIEKSEFIGGSSALSGGGIWVPNNHLMAQAGMRDSLENARRYLQHTVGERTSKIRQEAYLQTAPRMLAFLHEHTHARFMITPHYADYYPELPGGLPGGRSLEPAPFNSRKLGKLARTVRPSNIQPPLGLGLTAYEARHLYMLLRTLPALRVAGRMFLANLLTMASGGKRWTLGRGLVGRLLLSVHETGMPVRTKTRAIKLLVQDRQVLGVLVECEGQPLRILASKGVLLAAGGFEQDQKMRAAYLPNPTSTRWSAGNPANTGDAIRMGITAGGALDLMEDAWWTPVSLPPGQPAMIHIGERSFPRQVIVDSCGKRFTNEAAPYHQIGQTIYARNQPEQSSIPAFLVFDRRFRNRYIFGQTLPVFTPRHFIESGYFRRADTLEALAVKIGVHPQNLADTISRFNAFSKDGEDPDFGRGDSLYDRYYGDPSTMPNPCLGPIDKPPYYAVALYPGDLGTKGGLLTDEHARVLRPDGTVIDRLYACGNTSASVMGTTYPGAGATIGPAMTFGYLAALHAAQIS